MSLRMYAFAPACSARAMSSSASYVVSTTTRAWGSISRIRRTASTPSISGMRRTISTTSGRWSRNASMASRPFAASAMTSRSGSWLMMLATPVRNTDWPSTSTTRACLPTDPAGVGDASTVDLARQRYRESGLLPREHDFGAGSRGRHEGERRADPVRPFLHARHAEPGGAAIARDAAAIVRDRQPETNAAHRTRAHDDPAGACMPDGVGERFLGDADDFAFHAGVECRQFLDRELNRHVTRALREIDHAAERRRYVFAFGGVRPQRRNRTAGPRAMRTGARSRGRQACR